jgi:hypothetical protein
MIGPRRVGVGLGVRSGVGLGVEGARVGRGSGSVRDGVAVRTGVGSTVKLFEPLLFEFESDVLVLPSSKMGASVGEGVGSIVGSGDGEGDGSVSAPT